MSDVDISALRMSAAPPARRRRGPRITLIALVLVVLAVAASFLIPMLMPARLVDVVSVQAAGIEAGSRLTTAEAAGWVEPDPFPILIRPLVGGVLEELRVLEGHAVKGGETVVGRLRSAELEAAQDRARARVELEAEDLRNRLAELKVAQGLLEQRAGLRLQEARARYGLAAVHERLAAQRGALKAAQANRDAARAEYDGQKKLQEAGGTYPVALAKAEAALRASEATLVAHRHEIGALQEEEAEEKASLEIAQEVLEDPRALEGDVVTARANVAHRRAMLASAQVDLEIAARELQWATVRAPADGVVLKLMAAPGEVVGPDAKALVSIYDPKRLQARIDVPLGSMAGVRVGQEVEIRSEVTGSRKTMGKVLRIQRESDVLKNTLQVKVRLIDPGPLLVPETLCRARFLASKERPGGAGPELFRVPNAAVRGDAVFLLDPESGRARRVPVERVGEEQGMAVVRGALSVTHKVILDDVEDGERVEERP